MSLSNLQIFDNQIRTSFVEELDQRIDLFNTATRGGILLTSGTNPGDFAHKSFFNRVSGLVARRDPTDYTTPVSSLEISEALETSVKVGAYAKPTNISPGLWRWIGTDPIAAGIRVGQQAAEDALADMLNTSIAAFVGAINQEGTNVYDYSGTGTLTHGAMMSGASKMGDAFEKIVCNVMHSKSFFDLLGANIANAQNLFAFGTVMVKSDAIGRPIVISDSPALLNTQPSPDQYHSIGLVAGGIAVQRNDDFDQTIVDVTGKPNIMRVIQSQWSFNLGLKGFSYESTRGPTSAALATGTNWTQVATSNKDLAGVLVISQ
jgi:hypothetical protein